MKKSISAFTFLILLNIVLTGYGQDNAEPPVDITCEVKNQEIYIGDRIEVDVIAHKGPGEEIIFPEIPENLGEFSFIKSEPMGILHGKLGRWKDGKKTSMEGYRYFITIYETGTHVIPPIEVMYKNSEEEEWNVAESGQIPVEVKSLLTGKDKDIRALKGLLKYGLGFYWIIVILAVLAILGILYRKSLFKKIRMMEEARKMKTPYEIAYERLIHLRGQDFPGHGKVKEYYTELSDIVRQYLESRFSLRAPEMTTEEFMMEAKKSPALSSEHKGLLREFLTSCDMVKFAKHGPTQLEMIDSYKSVENLLDQTRAQEEDGEE